MEHTEELYKRMKARLDEYIAQKQMRRTPERYEVLRSICAFSDIFSIPQLDEKMRSEGAFHVSRSTLFNTLETFVEARLVIKHTLTRAAHYELQANNAARVYLVCQECGSIRRLERPELTKYLSGLKARLFSVRQPVLYLHGQCKKCTQALRRQASARTPKSQSQRPTTQKNLTERTQV